jgi:hypothetical protein
MKPNGQLLQSIQDKPAILFLPHVGIKNHISKLGLEAGEKKRVLHPKIQGAPACIGDGGIWRWMPIHDPGKRVRYVCIHGKRKETCKECGGSAICIHNHHRRFCRQCKGASLCWHGVQKSRCSLCKTHAVGRK